MTINWQTFVIGCLIGNLVVIGFSAFDGDITTTPLVGYLFGALVSFLILIVGEDWFKENE